MRGKNLRATDRKTVLFCVEDHFTVSRPALEWALAKVVNAGDSLHVVTVLAGRPPAPILGQTIDEEAVTRQLRAQEASAAETLQEAAAVIKASGLDCPFARYHALEPIGGTATALVEFARLHDIDIAVLGSRGVGALKSSVLPSVSGLGSVSNHCVHQIHAPVLVARQGCLGTFHIAQPITDSAATHSPRKNVCLAVDPSEGSMDMLRWALHHICTVEDNVHIVNVASPVMPPLQVATETEPSFFRQPSDKIHEEGHDDSENQRLWEERKQEAIQKSEDVARTALRNVVNDFASEREFAVVFKACCHGILPEGGSCGTGAAVCRFAAENSANLIILGNRDLGDFQRAMKNFVGLGSVCDHCTHYAPCPVLIYKH